MEGSPQGKTLELPKRVEIKYFSGAVREVVDQCIIATLVNYGRHFNQQKFILMRSAHKIILRKEFWKKHRVRLFPADNSFMWPEETIPMASFSTPITLNDPRWASKQLADAKRRRQADTLKEGQQMDQESSRRSKAETMQRN